jgi:PIN domain nuclease of toxin-antitoxin system
MNLILDTHLLIWGATADKRLSPYAKALIGDKANNLWFSSASIWEAAIKTALGRADFRHDVGQLRAGLLANGYKELAIAARHTVTYRDIPAYHRDPFDRLLVAQAVSEGMILATSDAVLAKYGPMVIAV